ncbi:Hypothetical protein H16_A1836 [Cupriavidus necator H16]|uniref:Uncharacterized protein n=1 Tax=Cupriavidus necator (strain ATCC 17699 / DSM 428 / KCTC 22496 / NCIMB 10442 / H16 / Stanier 337) TaxID=381666 RepID=Q0KAN2_CUPNH|nr:Hypothetical protein H16_A1836 [Cupriavidus necator H16]
MARHCPRRPPNISSSGRPSTAFARRHILAFLPRNSCTGVEASRLKVANSVGVGECRMSGRLSEADGWVSVFLTSRDHRSVKRRVTAYDFSHRASRIPALDCEHTFD